MAEVQITPTIINTSKAIIRGSYQVVSDVQKADEVEPHDLIVAETLAHAGLFLNLCRASGLDANEMLMVAATVHSGDPQISATVH